MIGAAIPRSASGPVLAVRALCVDTGRRRILHELTFDIPPGGRVGLIGASGSGKTIATLAVTGLLPRGMVASGAVEMAGNGPPQQRIADTVSVLELSDRQAAHIRGNRIGMVFQEPSTALNPTMRIDRQIAEAIRLHRRRIPRGERAGAVAALLRAVDLTDTERFARSYPHQLSGGQRQRVVLAMALANDPDLLICDEPTTALDVRVQSAVLDLIDDRITTSGAAMLFISHDLAVVAGMCDEVMVMWRGRIVERGPVTDVLADPQHPHTRELIDNLDVGRVAP